MIYDPEIHHRKSIRLRGYDYSQAGLYFITICTQNRRHLFGEIVGADSISAHDSMILNDAGGMIEQIWHEIPNDFDNTRLHEFVIMPNHIHGIIEIPVGVDSISAPNRAEMDSAPTLSDMVQSFKRHSTIKYITMVKQHILPPFDKRIWQRNYWEHIIRNENEYERIAQYIMDNPAKWEQDKLNVGSGNQVMESPAMYGRIPYPPNPSNEKSWMI